MVAGSHLLDRTPVELEATLAELGEPAYRARQVLAWTDERRARSF